MKIIIYMAMTVNGFIARENNGTDFVSEIEWDNFCKMIKNVGNIIIGRRTYEIMRDGGELARLEGVTIVAVSKNNNFQTVANNHLVAKSPKDAIRIIEEKEFDTTMVAGGGALNSSFMLENLVDEIYLDIEPIIFGKGIRLFAENNFVSKLELLGIKHLSPSEIQVHYKVNK